MSETFLPALVVILLVVAAAAIICVFVLLTKLNHSQINETAASERLTSKEKELAMSAAELAAVKEVLAKSQSEFMRSKEELAGLHARSELERSQFDERIAFIERSKEQLGESFKNIANDLLESKSKSLSQSSKKISRRYCRRCRRKSRNLRSVSKKHTTRNLKSVFPWPEKLSPYRP